jgi:hypothetical protein
MDAQEDRGSTQEPGIARKSRTAATADPRDDRGVDEQPAIPPTTKLLTEDDIRTGMALAQTVYAVIMTLGLKVAVEALYPALFAHERAKGGAFSPVVLTLVFLSVLLLAIRFFWVPRNLYEYVNHHMGSKNATEMKTTFRSLMLYHFPIALVHTLLFFGICEAFAEMTNTAETHAPAIHFIWIAVALLALNAGWLVFVTPAASSGPGRSIWARNNLFCALLAAAVLAGFYIAGFSVLVLLLAALLIFTANSLIDLIIAADKYILFDS